MEFHEIASIFPLMADAELQDLADDIRDHGQWNPIITFEGKILDGRNRLTACRLVGAEPRFEEFTGDAIAAVDLVWSLNLQRRHLDSSQRGMAEVKRAQAIESYRVVLEQMRAEAAENKKRKPKSVSQQIDAQKPAYAPFTNQAIRPPDERRTDAKRAKLAGTNRQYVRDAERLLAEAPDLAERVEAGNLKITQAKRELKRRRILERTDELEPLSDLAEQKFRCVYADPPWSYDNKAARGAADNHYLTMPLEEIAGLPVRDIVADKAVLFLWTTNARAAGWSPRGGAKSLG